MNEEYARKLAIQLLEIGAVKLKPEEPFTWSSGWKSPIYCDNRLTLSYPALRTSIKKGLSEMIKKHFSSVECIVGVATAGIPQGALVADELGLPFVYVRSKPKEHGMGNLIEGKMDEGQKVVIIEDLISTGGSSLKVAEAVQQSGGEVLGMAAIFTYGFISAEKAFAFKNIPLKTLSNYEFLIEEALEKGFIRPELLESLKAWRTEPESWKKI